MEIRSEGDARRSADLVQAIQALPQTKTDKEKPPGRRWKLGRTEVEKSHESALWSLCRLILARASS